jgi:hypothetical protein
MTEAEWLTGDDPERMLQFLEDKVSNRKFSLFAVACCYIFNRGELSPESLAEDFESVLRFVDGMGMRGRRVPTPNGHDDDIIWPAQPFRWAFELASTAAQSKEERYPTTAELVQLIREIFGNSFRPVAFSPSWRTDTALSLARQMYESRDFGAMPILADALQDAGCDSEDVLNHCRDANATHVRG